MSRKVKRFGISAVLLGAAVAGGLFWWKSGATAATEPPAEKVKVVRKDMTLKVASNGAVEPEFTVEIKSKASGVVDKVLAQEGDTVKKGQLLVRIDPITERRKVTQAQADVRIAESQRASVSSKQQFAISQLQRDESLLKKGLVAKEAVETQRREVAVLKSEASMSAAQVLRAREALREAMDRLSETRIASPIVGTVLERQVQPGQIVASGTSSVSGGTTLLKIADLRRLFVRVKVDEADIARVKPGNEVKVTADALPGKAFGGKVLRVAPQGKVENNVTVFEVVVEVDDSGRAALRPMMTANVEILVAQRPGTLSVPMRAVRKSKKNGGAAMVRLAMGESRKVELGISDGTNQEILAGLAEGDEVVIPSRTKKPGQKNRGGAQGGARVMRMGMGGGR